MRTIRFAVELIGWLCVVNAAVFAAIYGFMEFSRRTLSRKHRLQARIDRRVCRELERQFHESA